jgi:tetratricopeptide (TPR) repeat protein
VTAFNQTKSRLTLVLCSVLLLPACSTPEETAQQHIQTGRTYMEKGDLDNALLEFKSANLDGRHAEAYYGMALVDEKHNNLPAMRENLRSCLQVDDGMVLAKLKLAQVELGFGNLAEAMKQVDSVLVGHSDNIVAQLLKAAVYLKQGQYPEAAVMLDAVLSLQPDNAEALTTKAEYFIRIHKLDQALATSDMALAKNPDYRPLYPVRISIHTGLNDTVAVIADFKELIRLTPDNETYKLRLAAIYALSHNIPDAEALLRDLIKRSPDKVDNKLLLLQFLATHAPNRVTDEYDRWLNDQPPANPLLPVETRTGQLLELSKWMIANDLIEPAITGLNQIVTNEKDMQLNLTAQLILAEIAVKKNQYADAETAVDSILKQNSDFIEASFFKASLYLNQNRSDDTIKLLNGLVWSKDQSGDLYAYLGLAYFQKHDLQQVDINFKKALELNAANQLAFLPVYNHYLQNKQPELASQMLNKALKLKPHQDWLLSAKAEREIREKNWAEAQNTVQMLSMFSKDVLTTGYLQANILQGSGQFAGAIVIYQKLLALAPNHKVAMINLARCYEALKARDQAIAFFAGLHEKQPDNLAVVSVLGDLYVADKDLGKLKGLFHKQLKRTPKAVSLYIYLAQIAALEHKKPEEVKEILVNGLANNRDDPALSVALASWFQNSGDTGHARSIYEQMSEKHQDSEIVSNNLANILLDSAAASDISKGQALAQKFKDSDNIDYLDTYAWSQVKAGQTAKAVQLLIAVVGKAPQMADARYHLGVAYHDDAKKSLAIAELKQSINLSDQQHRDFVGKPNAIKLLQELVSN